MAYSEIQPEQAPASPGVKVETIPGQTDSVGGTGPDMSKFYGTAIGMGDKCIPSGQVPDTGDYADDEVSKPTGPLFDGPQAWPSSQLHSGVDAEK
jgi:hypothetical protein